MKKDYLQIIKEPLKDENDKVYGIIAIINNVTTSELLRQELREKSITDQLTGVYNRMYFEELSKTKQDNLEYPLTVISVDCDDLKNINDQFGHAAGDRYICYARDAIKECIGDNSFLFRMGGDEFLALVPKTDKQQAKELLEKIKSAAKKYKNNNFCLEMSIGSYTITKPSESIENAVNKSDREMYKNKKLHKNQ